MSRARGAAQYSETRRVLSYDYIRAVYVQFQLSRRALERFCSSRARKLCRLIFFFFSTSQFAVVSFTVTSYPAAAASVVRKDDDDQCDYESHQMRV